MTKIVLNWAPCTIIEHRWEQAVRDLLQTGTPKPTAVGWPMSQADLLAQSLKIRSAPGLSVFRTRFCLATMDLAADVPPAVAEPTITRLVTDVLWYEDANAARDLQRATPRHWPGHPWEAQGLIEASGLDIGRLPESAGESLSSALDLAETVIGAMPSGR